MTIYISGPMTGIKDFNRNAFFEAEEMLAQNGYRVLNPAKIGTLPDYEMYAPINRAMLDGADGIYQLPGWESSVGARMEYDYAMSLGLEVFF